jgi:Rod binding domain-containing protein
MTINFNMLSDNALTRSSASRINILKARTKALTAGNTGGSSHAAKFIDGHPVLPSDGTRNNKKLMNVCKDFESIFVNQLFKVMRKTVNQKNNILHGGHAEEAL